MPYKTGMWGEQAKERSERRLEYFRGYQQRRYSENRERIIARSKAYNEKHREEIREYRLKNKDRTLLRNKNYYREHQEELLRRSREHYKNNVEEYSAMSLAEYHVPLASKCILCGTTKNLERHHPNYSKPLEIVTLCRSCHLIIHRR